MILIHSFENKQHFYINIKKKKTFPSRERMLLNNDFIDRFTKSLGCPKVHLDYSSGWYENANELSGQPNIFVL